VGHIAKTCPQQKAQTGFREWCLHILRSRIKLQDTCHTKYLRYYTSLHFLISNSAVTMRPRKITQEITLNVKVSKNMW